MKHSEALDQIIPALVRAQSVVAVVPKSASNPHWKSLYQPFDAIMAAIKPQLYPNGLALTFGMEHGDQHGAEVTTTLWHTSGQWISESVWLPFAKLDPQGGCALLTYGSRRGGAGMFAIVADDDDDGNTASGITSHTEPVRAAPPAPKGKVQAMVEAGELPTERLPGPSSQQPKRERGPVPPCPQCGGPMWDNRDGKKNPKAPDFKCREGNGSCKDASGKWPFGMWEGRDSGVKPAKKQDNTDPHTFDDFPDALASDDPDDGLLF